MSKSEESTIEVKLFVDKEKKKVLFAESDKEFVDVLFSFLTMPLGTIVRLLGKQSQIGCLDQIYKSVEDLSSDYFQTKACKTMLLAPLNAASSHCSRLKINIDDTNPRAVYVCKDTDCCAHADCAFSLDPDAVCKCGKVLQYVGDMPENLPPCPDGGSLGPGVFVKGGFKFIITDDLIVEPSSTSLMLSLERFGVRDPANLKQTIIQLTSQKIISLLQRSLTSMKPLTGLYFGNPIHYDDTDFYGLFDKMYADQENDTEHKLNNVKIRVLQTNNSSLLYAGVSDGFIDLLFGLLSIPMGSLIRTYGQCSGCIHNLYNSIVANAKECVMSECLSLLVIPKSASFFGCGASKFLQAEDSAPKRLSIKACFKCLKIGGFSDLGRCRKQTSNYDRNYNLLIPYTYCQNTTKSTNLHELNPKSPNEGCENGEAYMKAVPIKFMVTSDLHVVPLSISNILQVVTEAKIRTGELLEKEIPVTKSLVMEIHRAALMSRTALSVLLPSKVKGRKLGHLRSGLYY